MSIREMAESLQKRSERYFMNMSVSSTGSSNSSQSAISANWQQRRQSFDALSQAFQSGDLSAAQSAFAEMPGHKGHRAHHHHHGAAAQSTDPSQINSATSNPGSTEGLIGSNINITV
jgi:hypothetical protein